MEKSYLLLLSLVIFLVLFIYFSYFFTSLRVIKQNEPETFKGNIKKEKWNWRNLIDSKNKSLSSIDLGNHILIIGIILLAIFILKNA